MLKPPPIQRTAQNRPKASPEVPLPQLAEEDQTDDPFLSDDVTSTTAKERVSSWGLSLIVHLILVVILALIILPNIEKKTEIEATFSTEIGDQLEFLTDDEGNLNPNEAENYALTVPEELKIDDAIIFEEKELPFVRDVSAPLYEQSRIEMKDLLSGRTDPGTKNDLLSKYGGNKLTQEAVANGLKWLREQQQKDGSWSLKEPYSGGIAGLENRPAATALALLAFQGDGNTRSFGEHSLVVKRGWGWLLKQQRSNGCFTPEAHSSSALFYTHAICTIALCELITMEKTNSSSIRKQARAAIDYLLENQSEKYGGWRYFAKEEYGTGDGLEESDLSVTGWCLMALKTAEMAGFEIPQTNYDRISAFLDSVSYDDGAGYVYRLKNGKIPPEEKRPSMTATGLMCREYLGWTPDNPAVIKAAESLASEENLIKFPEEATAAEDEEDEEDVSYNLNVYGWYSTSTALKGLGPYNKHWRRWNTALSRELPKQQEPKSSREAGSWSPKFDEYAFGGGRLYVTCMSILCLEVYYRHLALYR